MKKKILLLLMIILLTGCGINYPELKSDAINFEYGTYVDKSDDDAYYGVIYYKNRQYIQYGTQKRVIRENDLKESIGYINGDTDTRVITLSDDPDENYLMVHYIKSHFMNPPTFFRALDTKEKDIKTPSLIESLDYNFWK